MNPEKKHKIIITNSNDFDNYTSPYWLVYLTICSSFLNGKRVDLQSKMYIVRIVYIRVITLIALHCPHLLYNINNLNFFKWKESRHICNWNYVKTIIGSIPCVVFTFWHRGVQWVEWLRKQYEYFYILP